MKWTKAEDAKLRKYYPEMGMDAESHLPGRTREACKTRAKVLGVRALYPKNAVKGKEVRPWTAQELNVLRIKYPTIGSDVYKLLPGRTAGACQAQAAKLGVAQNQTTWTEEELQKLQEDQSSTCYEMASGFSRSAAAIMMQSRRMGLRRKFGKKNGTSRTTPRWSDDEIKILRDNYSSGAKECLAQLPGRTLSSIHSKAIRLGLSEGRVHTSAV